MTEFRLCTCNATMSLDGARLGRALGREQRPAVHRELCRHEVHHFRQALEAGGDMVVACTQEASLFAELAEEAGCTARLKFVNIREFAGWSAERDRAEPKIAALLAMAALPEPEPVTAVSYSSAGALLIVGPMDAAVAWAERLNSGMDVSVLCTAPRGTLPLRREYPVQSGRAVDITGYLGSFEVAWEQDNPIDLERCTRCNACLRACPEQAIGPDYQIDMDRCRAHRACVSACGPIGAIDFQRVERRRAERFDLVLDLQAQPSIRLPHPPQGYQAPGRDPLDQARAVLALTQLVGEFEKPKFFVYRERICAHARNGIAGCNRCIDTCSTGAIGDDGDRVKVEPHLCMGCGGCATVCPTGAIRHAYPSVPDLGARLKTMLRTYRAAGGAQACILFHDGERGRESLLALGRRGRGLPAWMIPLEVHDPACVGLDLMLACIAYGASECAVLAQADAPEAYLEATRRQADLGNTILEALGYGDRRLHLFTVADDDRALEATLWAMPGAPQPGEMAAFNLSEEKRTSLEFLLEHLHRHAPKPADSIALPAGAPWGDVEVDRGRCTLCMSCVGACPASALMDAPDVPRLRFVERNCVQCGLCQKTCPEDAITLRPRLLIGAEARRERILNEAEPFHCVRCGKPFGTRQMIDAMSAKLATHAMFADGRVVARIRMCADCRVADMMEGGDAISVLDL
jgi:ferredoxin